MIFFIFDSLLGLGADHLLLLLSRGILKITSGWWRYDYILPPLNHVYLILLHFEKSFSTVILALKWPNQPPIRRKVTYTVKNVPSSLDFRLVKSIFSAIKSLFGVRHRVKSVWGKIIPVSTVTIRTTYIHFSISWLLLPLNLKQNDLVLIKWQNGKIFPYRF